MPIDNVLLILEKRPPAFCLGGGAMLAAVLSFEDNRTTGKRLGRGLGDCACGIASYLTI